MYCTASQVLFQTGAIIAANLNAPGSWHDSRVAQPIYEKLRTQTPDEFYLVADTAFPRGAAHIDGRIRAPLKSDQRLRGTETQIAERMAFNRQLLSFRKTAECVRGHSPYLIPIHQKTTLTHQNTILTYPPALYFLSFYGHSTSFPSLPSPFSTYIPS